MVRNFFEIKLKQLSKYNIRIFIKDKLLKSSGFGCIQTISIKKKFLPYLGIRKSNEDLIFASQTNFYSWKEREDVMEYMCYHNDPLVSFALFENILVYNRRKSLNNSNNNSYKYETYSAEYPCSFINRLDVNDSILHYGVDSQKSWILASNFSYLYNFTKLGRKISTSQVDKEINCLIVLKDDKIAMSHQNGTIRIQNSFSKDSPIYLVTNDLNVKLTVLAQLIDLSLAAGYDNTIKVWSIDTRKIIYELTGHTGTISALTSLSNGILLSGSTDTTIKMWNTITRLLVRTLQGHTNTIKSFAVYPNYSLKFASLDEDTVKVWA